MNGKTNLTSISFWSCARIKCNNFFFSLFVDQQDFFSFSSVELSKTSATNPEISVFTFSWYVRNGCRSNSGYVARSSTSFRSLKKRAILSGDKVFRKFLNLRSVNKVLVFWCEFVSWQLRRIFLDHLSQLFKRRFPHFVRVFTGRYFNHRNTEWPDIWANIVIWKVSFGINSFRLEKLKRFEIKIFIKNQVKILPPCKACIPHRSFWPPNPQGTQKCRNRTFWRNPSG